MRTNGLIEDIEDLPLQATSDQTRQLVVNKCHLMNFLFSLDYLYIHASMTQISACEIKEKVLNCTLDNDVVMDLGQQCVPIFWPHFHRAYLSIGFF